MAERITWEQIDASPLLALPCEERARLRETGDERFRAFWDTCYRAYVAKEPGYGRHSFFYNIYQGRLPATSPTPKSPAKHSASICAAL